MALESDILKVEDHIAKGLEINVKKLGQCVFGTSQALYDVSGIVDGNK